MIYKTPHRKQGTNNDLQNTTQKARDKQWSTKHHTERKGQTMIYKAPHRKQGTNNDLQNTTQKTKDWATWTPLKTNNDLQNITQKTLDRATLTPQSTNIRQTMIFKTKHRKH